MRRTKAAVLLALFILGLGLVFAVAVQSRAAGKVYAVAEVTAGLAHRPKLWLGRTLLVRGRAIIFLCLNWSCPYSPQVLMDPNAPSAPVPFCPTPQSISLAY